MEDLTANLPPIDIQFSDLNVSLEDSYWSHAASALTGYWEQATIMTKAEQEEYYDLLVNQRVFVWEGKQPAGHKLYEEMKKGHITWPRWVLLCSIFGNETDGHIEDMVQIKYKNTGISSEWDEYNRYYPMSEIPDVNTTAKNVGESPTASESHPADPVQRTASRRRPVFTKQGEIEIDDETKEKIVEAATKQLVDKLTDKAIRDVAAKMKRSFDPMLVAIEKWAEETSDVIDSLAESARDMVDAIADVDPLE